MKSAYYELSGAEVDVMLRALRSFAAASADDSEEAMGLWARLWDEFPVDYSDEYEGGAL